MNSSLALLKALPKLDSWLAKIIIAVDSHTASPSTQFKLVCAISSLSSKIYSQYQRKVLNVKVVSISASNTDIVGNSNTIV